jgi:hypothetical protein
MNETRANNTQPGAAGGIKWWKTSDRAGDEAARPIVGTSCPKCYLGNLEFDSLFRLQCSNCGFIAECGAFT